MSRSVTSSVSNRFRTVTSSIGFSAGDYVYLNPNGYGRVADGLVSTATFPNDNFSVPYYKTQTDGSYASLKFETTNAGSSYSSNVAKLPNGNIVMVYFKGTSVSATTAPIYFKVVDSTGATVIAETQAATTNLGGSNGYGAAVCALANNGFAIAFTSSGGSLVTRTFNSSGASTSGEIVIGTISTTYRKIAMKGRSDSSFVIVYASNTNQPSYVVYSSTGTSVYSGTFGTTTLSGTSWCALSIRSDDSYQLFHGTTAGVRYAFFSATNTSLTSGIINTSVGNSIGVAAITLNSDVIMLVCNSTNNGEKNYQSIAANSVPSTFSNVLASNGNSASTDSSFEGARLEGTNNFVLVSCRASGSADSRGAPYGAGGLLCEVYNSTGTLLNQRPIYLTAFRSGNAMSGTSILTIGGNIRIYRQNVGVGAGNLSIQYAPKSNVIYTTVNVSNYMIAGPSSQTGTINAGNTSALAVNLYGRGTSLPAAAGFLSSATVSTYTTVPSATIIVPQTLVEAATATQLDMKPLGDGGFLICWQVGSTVKFATYNSAGTLITTVTVSTTAAAANAYACVLANGKIVILYSEGSVSTITASIYQGSGTSYTRTFNGNLVTGTINETRCLAAVGDGSNFVISYKAGANLPYIKVFDDTGISWFTSEIRNDGEFYALQMNADITGDIITWFYRLADNQGFTAVYRKSPVDYTTWVKIADSLLGTGATAEGPPKYSPNQSGKAFACFGSDFYVGGSFDIYSAFSEYSGGVSYYSNPASQPNGLIGSSMNTGGFVTKSFGFTGYGDFIMLTNRFRGNNTLQLINFATDGTTTAYWWNAIDLSANFSIPIVSGAGAAAAFLNVVPLAGNRIAVAMRNSSQQPTYGIIAGMSYDYPINITANVTSSNPVLTLALSTNYSLVGIAVTDCAAGGSGIIQVAGNAVLSASYPSTTSTAFNFQNYITEGRDGIVNGRNVILQGN